MKKKILSLCLLVLLSGFSLPWISLAQEEPGGGGTGTPESPLLNKLKNVGTGAGYDSSASPASALDMVGTIINVALGLLGTVFIILIIIAGFNWMTAAGEEEKIKKAGQTIRAAIIGLLIVVSAYAIWAFISTAILKDGAA